MKTTPPLIALAFAAATLLPGTAHGAIVINIEQQGSDVVASYSGSWDNWARVGFSSAVLGGRVSEVGMFNRTTFVEVGSVGGLTLQEGIWTTVTTNASSTEGDVFGWDASVIWAPGVGDYVAGKQFSGSLTFSGTDLTTLGFTPGDTGVFSGGGNTATYSVSGGGPAPVPEPGTWAAAAFLVSGAAFVRWRRRQRTAG